MKFATDVVTIHRFTDRWARDRSRDRIRDPGLLLPASSAVARAYLRDLRAAELAAWEVTGGDYLISQKDKGKQ